MAKKVINSAADFLSLNGKELGVSEWFEVSQDVINNFADATYDHQWIHTDTERAKKESPHGTTIAHGYLTLSLLPYFLGKIIEVNNLRQLVNYSIEKMVYRSAVAAGSRIRLSACLTKVKDLGALVKANIACRFEVEGEETPALEGSIVYLYYFK